MPETAAVLVVFPTPLPGIEYREQGGSRKVTIHALHGSPERGYADRTALVVDEHGNLDWIETAGLGVDLEGESHA